MRFPPRVLGPTEVTCATECSASVDVALALDVAKCNRLLMALSSCQRVLVILREITTACALLVLTLALMEADGCLRKRKRKRNMPVA